MKGATLKTAPLYHFHVPFYLDFHLRFYFSSTAVFLVVTTLTSLLLLQLA